MIREFLKTNPLLKGLSLGLAFFLWSIVHSEQPTEIGLSVKIAPKNIPANLVIAGDLDSEIRLKIVGPRTRVKHLKEKGLPPYEIDLHDAILGMNTITFEEENFHIPRAMKITRFSPSALHITLDHAEERMVRVDPRFVGSLEEGFEIENYQAIPPSVKVRGARSELETLTALRTAPIQLVGRTESFESAFPLQEFRPNWRVEVKNVTVKVKIREREVSKILDSVPVLVAGMTQEYKVEPNTVALKIKGLAGKVRPVLGEKLEVSVDAKALGLEARGKSSYRIRPVPPRRAGVEITMIPDNVRLTLITN